MKKTAKKLMTLTPKQKLEAQLVSLMYHDSKQYAFDVIELAQMEFRKNGGEVTVCKMRKPRKTESAGMKIGVNYAKAQKPAEVTPYFSLHTVTPK